MKSSFASHVSIESWNPDQIPTSLKLMKATDYYEQSFLKFSGVGQFHSRAELLHAALLEADPGVRRFVPQSHRFRLGSSWYIPDCFIETNDTKTLCELKSKAKFDLKKFELLNEICSRKGVEFKVIANEEIFDQEILAENWLSFIRELLLNEDLNTNLAEKLILSKIGENFSISIKDLIDPQDFQNSIANKIGLLRLLHSGTIKAELRYEPLSAQTDFTLC